MCGIVGVYGYNGKQVSPELLGKMRDTMRHRGPDGANTWISPDGSVGLAHRRLSIVDLSTVAGQPMSNEDDTIWITFNGEIYNHQQLRPELVKRGHDFRTDHSDTEVLVHGYEEWGIDGLLERITGDYGFAILDQKDGSLYVARDRIGVKPLYFAEVDGQFTFASEIKALLAHPALVPDIDPAAMVHYLSFLTTPAPLTMFKGVYKLAAGSWMKISPGGTIEVTQYYVARPGRGIDRSQTDNLSSAALENFYVDGIRERLSSAVEKRMMSDVSFGVFLSGGVDSSTNVALMSRFTDSRINTFTVGYKNDAELNELNYARIAAEQFDTNHHEVLIDEDDMVGYLQNMVYHQDEPLADWVCVPLYFVSKLAHDHGIKVVQVGEGADEQFAGYQGYLKYLKLYQKAWSPFRTFVPNAVQSAVAGVAAWASDFHPKLDVYADIADRAANDRGHFWILSMSFWNATKKRLLRSENLGSVKHHDRMIAAGILDPGYVRPDSFNVIKSFSDELGVSSPGHDVLAGMVYNEFRLRLPELLLMRVDKISMSVSLEARVPFLDQELVDFSFDIPEEFKVKNGVSKYLLKKAVEGIIPDELIYRRKMGFDVPMIKWLKGEFGQRVEREILSSRMMDRGFFHVAYIREMFSDHRLGRANRAQQLWTLYNLTAWYDYWVDAPADVAA
ncbi:asparagine synthase (glutamine-hydrolyzing) [Tardiphaga sp.]|uniref:asparagine synthase (glutamine-hydrolyzing) n=1 Tax=Tardiphaga sp. TaxID=1926292 RepID=UPI002633166F|nr:asparagine synthase (glutamine-hydrolyzing) [Tardiphaga sp.]MDB5618896.1 hypothetical protein [Tardiphaga sp.]